MAEIRVERKTTSVWTWLVPLLLVVAALWWFLGRGPVRTVAGRGTVDSAGAYNRAPVATADSAATGISDFTSFISAQNAMRDENQQHAFTAGGIRRLAAALSGMQVGEGTSTKIAEMREQANALESSSASSDKHAEMARTAFIAAADVFRDLPAERVSGDIVAQVRAAAQAMKSAPTLLEQKDQIDAFFDAASRALRGAKS